MHLLQALNPPAAPRLINKRRAISRQRWRNDWPWLVQSEERPRLWHHLNLVSFQLPLFLLLPFYPLINLLIGLFGCLSTLLSNCTSTCSYFRVPIQHPLLIFAVELTENTNFIFQISVRLICKDTVIFPEVILPSLLTAYLQSRIKGSWNNKSSQNRWISWWFLTKWNIFFPVFFLFFRKIWSQNVNISSSYLQQEETLHHSDLTVYKVLYIFTQASWELRDKQQAEILHSAGIIRKRKADNAKPVTSLFDLVSCLSHVQSRQNARRANSASVQQIGGWNASVNNQTRDPDKSKQTLSIFGVISCSPSTHLFLISYLRPNSAPAGAPVQLID